MCESNPTNTKEETPKDKEQEQKQTQHQDVELELEQEKEHDHDKTPRLQCPMGFKKIKTSECFADLFKDIEIPNEKPKPITLPKSNVHSKHSFKRIGSEVYLAFKVKAYKSNEVKEY